MRKSNYKRFTAERFVLLLGFDARSNPAKPRMPKPLRPIQEEDIDRIRRAEKVYGQAERLSIDPKLVSDYEEEIAQRRKKISKLAVEDVQKYIKERGGARRTEAGVASFLHSDLPRLIKKIDWKIFAYNLIGETSQIIEDDGFWLEPVIEGGQVQYQRIGGKESEGKTSIEKAKARVKRLKEKDNKKLEISEVRRISGEVTQFTAQQVEALKKLRKIALDRIEGRLTKKLAIDRYMEAVKKINDVRLEELQHVIGTAAIKTITKTPGQRQALRMAAQERTAKRLRSPEMRRIAKEKKQAFRELARTASKTGVPVLTEEEVGPGFPLRKKRRQEALSLEEKFEKATWKRKARFKDLLKAIERSYQDADIFSIDLTEGQARKLEEYESTMDSLIEEGQEGTPLFKSLERQYEKAVNSIKNTLTQLEYEKEAKKLEGSEYIQFSEFEAKQKSKPRPTDDIFEIKDLGSGESFLGRLEDMSDRIEFLRNEIAKLDPLKRGGSVQFSVTGEDRKKRLRQLKFFSENTFKYELYLKTSKATETPILLVEGYAADKGAASAALNILVRILERIIIKKCNYASLTRPDKTWISNNLDRIEFMEPELAKMMTLGDPVMPSDVKVALEGFKKQGKMEQVMKQVNKAKDCYNMTIGEERMIDRRGFSYYVKRTEKGFTYQVFFGDRATSKRGLRSNDCDELERRIFRLAGGVLGASEIAKVRENPEKSTKVIVNAYRGMSRTMKKNSSKRKKNPVSRQTPISLPKEAARPEDIQDLTQLFTVPRDPDDAFRVGYYFGVIRGIDTCGIKNIINRRKIRDRFSKRVLDAVMGIPDRAALKATAKGRSGESSKDDEFDFGRF